MLGVRIVAPIDVLLKIRLNEFLYLLYFCYFLCRYYLSRHAWHAMLRAVKSLDLYDLDHCDLDHDYEYGYGFHHENEHHDRDCQYPHHVHGHGYGYVHGRVHVRAYVHENNFLALSCP